MPHLVLLGDSIFDNGVYVEPGHATIDAVRKRLPAGWEAKLLARSAGGNDAITQATVLGERAGTVGDALLRLRHIADEFEREYVAMLRQVAALRLPTIVCVCDHPACYANEIEPSAIGSAKIAEALLSLIEV